MYPIRPYFKICREWIMRHNCLGHKVVWIWPKLCPNCTIALKEDFWGKLTNANFVNLLCPIMQKYFKTKLCGRSWDIGLNNFGPNWAKIVILLEKMIFWENWLMLLLSTNCAPLCYKVSKRVLSVLQIMRYKVLQFWAKLDTNYQFILKKGIFFWKIDWC